eukprot:jgi/Astpho2/6384/fgenesh1_pg.00091_%23_43_t
MTSWTFWYRAVSCAGPLCRQAAWARWLLCLSTFSHSLTIACQQHEMNLLLLVGLLLLLQLGAHVHQLGCSAAAGKRGLCGCGPEASGPGNLLISCSECSFAFTRASMGCNACCRAASEGQPCRRVSQAAFRHSTSTLADMSTIVLTSLLLSQLIGLTDFIFSQDCSDELEKLTAATTAKAQVGMCLQSTPAGHALVWCEAANEQKALMDSSNKGEEGVQLQKLLPALQTSRSQASLLKESRSQASLKTSQA